MPDYGFGRCDGHHETVDFRLRKIGARRRSAIKKIEMRTLPAGFIAPCLPTKTDKLPSGGLWLHEIKHDGFRIIARKNGERVRLYSRPGY